MHYQSRSGADDITVPALEKEASGLRPTPVPRRRLIRTLTGVAMGAVVLVGLASCGGEGGDEDEEDDD